MHNPIDAVITWVDGDDPTHKARRLEAMGTDRTLMSEEVGGDTRFKDMGEIRWTLAAINKFMPWVRNIYIVTDKQAPSKEMEWIRQHFPSCIPMEIIDHTIIFKGYEEYLPLFNSLAIGTMLWRIPGLSEHYIYFNDDTMPISYMTPHDWFIGDKMVCHGHIYSRLWTELINKTRNFIQGKPHIGFKSAMIKTAAQLNKNYFIYFYHSPLSQSKSILENYFIGHPKAITENIKYRFRSPEQFSANSLCNLLAFQENKLILNRTNINLFLKPDASKPNYLKSHLQKADRNRALKLLCINSLDKTSIEEKLRFENWIKNRLFGF